MAVGLLIARLILGAALAAHGAQKLFGWFGGHGVKGTGEFMESLGFHPGARFAVATGLAETGGGVLTALGLLGPVGPALIVLVLLVAMGSVHWTRGFWASANGIELPLAWVTAAFALAFAGPGAISLDAALGFGGVSRATAAWVAMLVAVALSLASLASRRPRAPTPAAAGSHA